MVVRTCLAIFLLVAFSASATAQNIPSQLINDAASLSAEQATTLARQLGIDLADQEGALRRARELGISEALIRSLIASSGGASVSPATEVAVARVDTAGVAAMEREMARQQQRAVAMRDSIENATATEVVTGPSPFGYNVFSNTARSSRTGPVDDGYIVGAGDDIRLTMWGAEEFQTTLFVDADGRIFVPNVGLIPVSGRSLRGLRSYLRSAMAQNYAGLVADPPTVFLDITLTRQQPTELYLLGEVARPGGFVAPASSNVFALLQSIGGPLTSGSLRDIRVMRSGKQVASIDLYNYLLTGADPNDRVLRTGDVIFVPRIGRKVSLQGEVRSPAVFELRPGEHLGSLIEFGGGLLPTAFAGRAQIERIVPPEMRTDQSIARELKDVVLADVLSGRANVDLLDGDHVTVFGISDRIDQVITISGAVFQPGRYELNPNVRTISDALRLAGGLTERAHYERAELRRVGADLSREVFSFDLGAVVRGADDAGIVLRNGDQLIVFNKSNLQTEPSVEIEGRVKEPGAFPFRRGMHARELLYAGGGLQDSTFLKSVWMSRASLFRSTMDGEQTVMALDLSDIIQGGDSNIALEPGDRLVIYPKNVARLGAKSVSIDGAVNAPGAFEYSDGLTLEDLIIEAGGFQDDADLQVVEISRESRTPGDEVLGSVLVNLSDLAASQLNADPERVAALLNQRRISLLPGDKVAIRRSRSSMDHGAVNIDGEVARPGVYPLLNRNESISSVIKRAGGLLPDSFESGTEFVRDDSVRILIEMSEVLKGRTDVVLRNGDRITVPRRPGTVHLVGNVGREGLVRFKPSQNLSYYLERAGGLGERTASVQVTDAAGFTKRVRRGLIPSNPRITEGSTIEVTRKPDEVGGGTSIRDVLQEATAILGFVVSTLSVIALTRNL